MRFHKKKTRTVVRAGLSVSVVNFVLFGLSLGYAKNNITSIAL